MDFRAGYSRTRQERRRKDSDQAGWGGADRRQPLAEIRWKNADGTVSGGHPLPRAHAEALLRAFMRQYPEPTFWLEVPPALDETIRFR